MNRKQLTRRIGAALAAVSLVALSVGATTAATPNWFFDAQNLSPVVTPGATAGYAIKIRNDGPSNISSLFLTSSIASPAVFVDGDRSSTCVLSPVLKCSFGAVTAGTELNLRVAYNTPSSGSKFDVTFQLNTNGSTFSDKGGNSRGDTKNAPVSTTLNANANFRGAWVLNDPLVSNSTDLRNNNRQSTQIVAPKSTINVTVEDGITTDPTCNTDCPTGTLIGEWSRLNVDNGATFASAFKVIVTLRGQNLPSPKPAEADISVFHLDDAGVGHTITDRCDDPNQPSSVPTDGCIYPTYVGQNLQVVIWLHSNGYTKTRL